jgi:hypothetical protein
MVSLLQTQLKSTNVQFVDARYIKFRRSISRLFPISYLFGLVGIGSALYLLENVQKLLDLISGNVN